MFVDEKTFLDTTFLEFGEGFPGYSRVVENNIVYLDIYTVSRYGLYLRKRLTEIRKKPSSVNFIGIWSYSGKNILDIDKSGTLNTFVDTETGIKYVVNRTTTTTSIEIN
jgi:hypothetical protein